MRATPKESRNPNREAALFALAREKPVGKHAEVTVPSLDDWERDWEKNPQRSAQPKLLPVNFRAAVMPSRDGGSDSALLAVAQTN